MTDADFRKELAKAEAGSAVSQAYLGGLLMYGIGVEVDYPLAHRLLSLAHAQGVLSATASLGSMYLNGWGVGRDVRRGVELLEDAASRGHWPCLIDLARVYRTGDGVGSDAHRAARYYRQAYDEADDENDWLGSEEWEEARDYLIDQGLLPAP